MTKKKETKNEASYFLFRNKFQNFRVNFGKFFIPFCWRFTIIIDDIIIYRLKLIHERMREEKVIVNWIVDSWLEKYFISLFFRRNI